MHLPSRIPVPSLLPLGVVGVLLFWLAPISFAMAQHNGNVEDWIVGLNSDSWTCREQCENQLMAAGLEAIDPLTAAALSGAPEVRTRAVQVLAGLAVCGNADVMNVAQQRLNELAKSNDGNVARAASKEIDQLGSALEAISLEHLRKLGAIVDQEIIVGDFAQASFVNLIVGPEWKGTRADLDRLRWVPGLTNATLIGEQIDDSLLNVITRHEQLNNLVLKRTAITNTGVTYLTRLTDLNTLHLIYCDVDDGCLDDMKRLVSRSNNPTSLYELRLYGTRISKAGAATLEEDASTTIDHRNGAYLGIYFIQGTDPCVVSRVVSNSAAERAGFQTGDQIIRFAGEPVETGNDFRGAVSDFFPGDSIKCTILRGEEEIELEITLGRFPDLEQ